MKFFAATDHFPNLIQAEKINLCDFFRARYERSVVLATKNSQKKFAAIAYIFIFTHKLQRDVANTSFFLQLCRGTFGISFSSYHMPRASSNPGVRRKLYLTAAQLHCHLTAVIENKDVRDSMRQFFVVGFL